MKNVTVRTGTFKAADPAKPTGLGDLVGKIATPIAAALGLPCVDPATRQLRPESPCARRKAALNAAFPDVKHPLRPVDKAR
jgi:hypothetical protein